MKKSVAIAAIMIAFCCSATAAYAAFMTCVYDNLPMSFTGQTQMINGRGYDVYMCAQGHKMLVPESR